ncbi:MAG: hypothetical protein WAT66_02815 [Actinomycetota bacterium]
MMRSFIQEEAAREHNRALVIASQRAAESVRYRRMHRKRSRLSKAIGVGLVRFGLKFTGGRAAVVLRGTRSAPEPMLVRR